MYLKYELSVVCLSLGIFFNPLSLRAQTTEWISPGLGNYTTPSNWSNGVPTFLDDVLFGLNVPEYGPLFSDTTGNRGIRSLEVTAGAASISSLPASSIQNVLDVGNGDLENGNVEVHNSELWVGGIHLKTSNRIFVNENATFGVYGETPGSLVSSSEFFTQGDAILRSNFLGEAIVDISNSTLLNPGGTIVVEGGDASWKTQTLYVASGNLTVQDGSEFESVQRSSVYGGGNIRVSGSSSEFRTLNLTVGQQSSGTVSSGTVFVGNQGYLQANFLGVTPEGEVNVSDSVGSIGNMNSQGNFIVQGGARLTGNSAAITEGQLHVAGDSAFEFTSMSLVGNLMTESGGRVSLSDRFSVFAGGFASIENGGVLTAENGSTDIQEGGLVFVNGGTFKMGQTTYDSFARVQATSGTIEGTVLFDDTAAIESLIPLNFPLANISNLVLENQGFLAGGGTIHSSLQNSQSGEIEVAMGERLRFRGSSNQNGGRSIIWEGIFVSKMNLRIMQTGLWQGVVFLLPTTGQTRALSPCPETRQISWAILKS